MDGISYLKNSFYSQIMLGGYNVNEGGKPPSPYNKGKIYWSKVKKNYIWNIIAAMW